MIDFFKLKRPKILVIGDIIIDKYIWGQCERISPEAPVQVVLANKKDQKLGGAANVYANLLALKSLVQILSIVGDDENLPFLKASLKGELIVKKGYKTPVKSRIIVSNQQILRLDEEKILASFDEQAFLKCFSKMAFDYDAFVLSDYNKGLLTASVCKYIIAYAKEANKPVLIDPKGKDYSKYEGATLLTPNKKEAIAAGYLGEDLKASLLKMKKDLKLKYPLITLSEEGIAVYKDGLHIIPAKAQEVYDVTGAGDSVIAMLAFSLAQNIDIRYACELANTAAAVVVSKIGSAQASLDDIKNQERQGFENKIVNKKDLAKICKDLEKKGKKIIFTNGCFDILHFGHLSYLQKARRLGDLLVVGLNSDASVKRLKGNDRPINTQAHRAAMLAALSFVDFVVIFDEDDPHSLISSIKAHILVKGADYEGKSVIGADLVEKLVLIDFEPGLSTTNLIRRINDIKG